MIKIFVYSAIKIRAKDPLLYSMLNPETSSDSPSARSKGVRFVSASVEINHVNRIGIISNIIQLICVEANEVKLKVALAHRALNKIRAILTS